AAGGGGGAGDHRAGAKPRGLPLGGPAREAAPDPALDLVPFEMAPPRLRLGRCLPFEEVRQFRPERLVGGGPAQLHAFGLGKKKGGSESPDFANSVAPAGRTLA